MGKVEDLKRGYSDLSPELQARIVEFRKRQTIGPAEEAIQLLADIEAARAAKGTRDGQDR